MSLSIRLSNLAHGFVSQGRPIPLFSGLDHHFAAGEITAIVGTSGCGKSTLLSLLAGLEPPQQGTVRYAWRSTDGEHSIENIRQHSGFIFQQFHLLDELDALHNVALPQKLRGNKQALEQAKLWLGKVGLSERLSHSVTRLSGGEQQRVAIARAFVSQPAVVFADEPTGNLDEQTALEVTNIMLECCRQQGSSLILVTHDKTLAEKADTVLRLHHGQLEPCR